MRFRRLFALLFFAVSLHAQSYIAAHFGAWRYVFEVFDLPPAYVNDPALNRFAKQHRKRYERLIRKLQSEKSDYIAAIRRMLLQEDMDDLFLYMAIVESALDDTALSCKSAKGVWQLMPATAKRYRLYVGKGYDARSDLVASTHAAMRYLRTLVKRFDKRYLALIAYNCGEGRLAQVLRKVADDSPKALLGAKSPLPQESKGYLKKVLLTALIGESQKIFSLKPRETLYAVTLPPGSYLPLVAKRAGITLKQLRQENPAFKKSYTPKDIPATLYLREGAFLRYQLSAPNPQGFCAKLLGYTVERGDSLAAIAVRFHSDASLIKRVNGLDKAYLQVGRTLVVPQCR